MSEPGDEKTQEVSYRPEEVAELQKAGRRVGYAPADLMRWLIRFASIELRILSRGDLLNIQYELTHFIWNGTWQRDGGYSILEQPKVKGAHYVMPLLPLPRLCQWQEGIRGCLKGIFSGAILTFECPPMRINLRPVIKRGTRHWTVDYFSETPNGPLQFAAARILSIFANQVHECGNDQCQRIFLPDRKNQKFCSGQCQNRVGTQRYREAHGLITGRKRGRPPKGQSKTAAPEREVKKGRSEIDVLG